MRVLRDAEGLGLAANAAARILRSALELVLKAYRPGELESFRRTADHEINPMFAELGPTDVTYANPLE